jgi:hypothetical protein
MTAAPGVFWLDQVSAVPPGIDYGFDNFGWHSGLIHQGNQHCSRFRLDGLDTAGY